MPLSRACSRTRGGVAAAHAQFGSGIVFDPTQSGHAIVQIEHEEQSISNQMQQIENGQQIFTNTVKIASTALQTYNQIVQQYNLYHQMMVAPQLLYAALPVSDDRLDDDAADRQPLWQWSVLDGSIPRIPARLRRPPSNLPVSLALTARSPYGTSQPSRASNNIAAQGATVDLGDSVAATNLQTIGTIRANQTARQADITALENATNTTDPSQETEMAVLQRINHALASPASHHAGRQPDQRQRSPCSRWLPRSSNRTQ